MPQTAAAPQLILASGSVYRRELLGRLTESFEVMAPDIDEARLPAEHPAMMAARLAMAKAAAVAEKHPDAVLDSHVPVPDGDLADRVDALSRELHAARARARADLEALQAAVDAYVAGALDETGLAAAVAEIRARSG